MSFARLLGPALFLSLLAAGVVPASAARDPADLAGYRALYSLTLDRPDVAGSAVGVAGRLAIDFADACTGYALSQRLMMAVTDSDGTTRDNDFVISTWESHDGLTLRFNLNNDIDGQPVERYAGLARLKSHKQGGKVTFTEPAGDTMALPPGTVFPTEQIRRLIIAAEKGETFRADTVFDGSGADGLTDSSGAIGRKTPAHAAPVGTPLAALDGEPSWPMRIAYFALHDTDAVPQYEIGLRLFANGVAGDLLLDYGDFAVRATLVHLALSPTPNCRGK